jgi:hypothetical protein
MYGRWVNLGVLVLWLATMTWLVSEKIAPTLLVGDPPSTETVLEARAKEPLAGWRLRWNGRSVGWALSLTRTNPDDSTEILSRVHFEKLPIHEMTPGWLQAVLDRFKMGALNLSADAETSVMVDPEGRFAGVNSSVRFHPLNEAITLTGRVNGPKMKVVVRFEDMNYKTVIPVNPGSLYSENLSPQTHLPNLRRGQTWTVEVCSPLGYPNNPVEVLQAKVAGLVDLEWQGKWEPVWLVEYRNTPGFRLSTTGRARGRLWVRMDGTVLIQEINVFGEKMRFLRMSPAEAESLAEENGIAVHGEQ